MEYAESNKVFLYQKPGSQGNRQSQSKNLYEIVFLPAVGQGRAGLPPYLQNLTFDSVLIFSRSFAQGPQYLLCQVLPFREKGEFFRNWVKN